MKGPFVHPNDRIGQASGLGPNLIIIVGGNLLVSFSMQIKLGIALLVIALYALNANNHTLESQTLPIGPTCTRRRGGRGIVLNVFKRYGFAFDMSPRMAR